MNQRLDRTEQRIVGVLIEKALSVPDSYPLSENALLDGCNQKSNRDPVMDLQPFQLAGALLSLREKGWVVRVEGGGRATRYRHQVVERLGLSAAELAVFAELLLRGPQAPGALKPRVLRMGLHAEPDRIEAVLRGLLARPQPLVEQLPLGPRERDQRWRHLVGDGSEAVVADGGGQEPAGAAAPVLRPKATAAGADVMAALVARVDTLEQQVAALQQRLNRLLLTREEDD